MERKRGREVIYGTDGDKPQSGDPWSWLAGSWVEWGICTYPSRDTAPEGARSWGADSDLVAGQGRFNVGPPRCGAAGGGIGMKGRTVGMMEGEKGKETKGAAAVDRATHSLSDNSLEPKRKEKKEENSFSSGCVYVHRSGYFLTSRVHTYPEESVLVRKGSQIDHQTIKPINRCRRPSKTSVKELRLAMCQLSRPRDRASWASGIIGQPQCSGDGICSCTIHITRDLAGGSGM